jgi:hypothetical protein
MRILDNLLGRKLIEDLLGSPNWECTWWTDVVFRGLQEGGRDDLGTEPERAGTPGIENRELL